jgi:hypothetical protein
LHLSWHIPRSRVTFLAWPISLDANFVHEVRDCFYVSYSDQTGDR